MTCCKKTEKKTEISDVVAAIVKNRHFFDVFSENYENPFLDANKHISTSFGHPGGRKDKNPKTEENPRKTTKVYLKMVIFGCLPIGWPKKMPSFHSVHKKGKIPNG